MCMIFHRIRIINLRRLAGAAAFLLITCTIFYHIPFFDIVMPTQIEELSSIVSLYQEGTTYIELTADTLYYTGYDYTQNGKRTGSYYYAIDDSTCIYFLLPEELCESRPAQLSHVPVRARLQSGGKLQTELIQRMSSDLGWTAQGLSSVSSRILINAADYLLLKHAVLFAASLIVFVISLITAFHTILQLVYPLLYPACFRLRRYGSVKEQVAQAEAELREPALLQAGAFTITKHYLVYMTRAQLSLLPLDEILWGYKHSSLHRFRLRRLRLTYTLRILARGGAVLIADSQPKEAVDAVLDYLAGYNSEILIGYTKKNERLARQRR